MAEDKRWCDFRDESRGKYGCFRTRDVGVTVEKLNAGSLQRIADATELMAQDYRRMQRELEFLKGLSENRMKTIESLRRSNAALRGHVGRLKR